MRDGLKETLSSKELFPGQAAECKDLSFLKRSKTKWHITDSNYPLQKLLPDTDTGTLVAAGCSGHSS